MNHNMDWRSMESKHGVTDDSNRLQLPDVADVPVADWAKVGGFDRGNGNRLAGVGHKFHFISSAVLINMNDRAHVAGHNTFFRQIGGQHHAIEFFDFHQSCQGYAAIRRGATIPWST